MNVCKLNEAMEKRGYTLTNLSNEIGMSYQCIQYRNKNNAWKAREAKEVAEILGLTDEETIEIFFLDDK